MLELGSAVNIMPVPIYYEFQFEILYFANILVQLADFFLVRHLDLVKEVLL